MNTKVLLAGFAGGVAAFFLGWLLYGILFMDIMRSLSNVVEGVEKNPPDMWAIALSNLLWGWLYAIIFDRWAGIKTFRTGALAGLWIGVLLAASIDLSLFSMYNMWTLPGVALDVVISAVMSAVIGGVVGLVLGYGNK